MRFANIFALSLGLSCAAFGGCATPFPYAGKGNRLVTILEDADAGSPDARLPLAVTAPRTFRLRIEARTKDGAIDGAFAHYVRVSVQPGEVAAIRHPNANGRNVGLGGGIAEGVEIDVVGAYGDTRLWAEDVGYTPATATDRPPACADGVDNDRDNLPDYPYDPGCFAANDDSEESGTYAVGLSTPIFFERPRIADVQGAESGGEVPPFKNREVVLDTGWHAPRSLPDQKGQLTPERFDFDVVVTRVSGTGFFATDLGPSKYRDDVARKDPTRDAGYPFASIFAFTFSSPGGLRVCDRIRSLTGTSTEFFGQVQLSSPSFVVERWDSRKRGCLVPEPFVLRPSDLDPGDQSVLSRNESALVRVATDDVTAVSLGRHFGRQQPAAPAFEPTDEASNCDLNGDGKVEFLAARDANEAACAKACKDDVECSEFSTFVERGHFALVVRQGENARKVQANAAAAGAFKPQDHRGQALRSFTGTLGYFVGGSQFTIEARCDDDVIADLARSPLTSSEACVRARTIEDPNENSQ